MSTTPTCATPVTLQPLPVSPSVLEQLRAEDDSLSLDFDGANSPTSKRCPTFKEFSDKIKQLQKENFQLRVRIYLNERESGVKTSSSEIAVLYSQHPHLLNGIGNQVPTHSTANVQSSPSSTSAASASAFDTLTNELEKVKAEKEELKIKLNELEARHNAKLSELEKRNEEICQKNDELSQELASATSTIQKLNENQSSATNEETIEKLACFAFGENEDVELINTQLQQQLSEKNSLVARLEAELEIARRRLASAEKKIEGLKAEDRRHKSDKSQMEVKYQEMSEALRDMGSKYLHEKKKNDRLEKKLTQGAAENAEKIAYSTSADKYESIQQLVSLLLDRMKEITDFVKTLLQLETQKVVTLPLLTDENRASLHKSVEQCRLFSKNLEELLYKKDQIAESHATSNYFGRESHYGNSRNHHYSPLTSPAANHSRSLFSALDRVRLKNDGVQCNIVDSSLITSLDSANSYISQLKHDMSGLHRINHQLGQEKAELISQVKTLESNVLRISNHTESSENIQLMNSKLKEENRKLKSRLLVAEEALKDLHIQHATIVGELKKMKSVNHKTIHTSASVGSTIVDSNRPSDSTSPDLGIDSGHDGAMNSDDSNANNYKEENRILRTTNRELALKLKQTRQALDNTIEKLNSTTKEKEQVEKAICRQLHKTHTILRQAKRSVEKFTNSQCQENIMPSSS